MQVINHVRMYTTVRQDTRPLRNCLINAIRNLALEIGKRTQGGT